MKTNRNQTIIGTGLLVIIFSSMMLFEPASAQPGSSADFNARKAFEQFMAECTKELTLTKEQETQMRSILEKQFEEQKAYREKMRSEDKRDFRTMKKEMQRIRENTDAQLKPVLTDDQMKEFQSLR